MIFAASQHCAAQYCTQTVPLNVLDEKTGLSITAVPAEALEALGKAGLLRVTGIEQIHTRRLLVLIDQSGSIAQAGDDVFSHDKKAIQITLRVLNEVLGELPAGLSVEYGLFDDRWVFGDAFTSDSKTLRNSIADVNTRFAKTGKGHTAIYDALHEGIMRFQATQPEDAILLFSDGDDNSSKRSARQLETELRATGVRLFTILLDRHASSPQQQEQRQTMIDLTQRSGGIVHVLDTTQPGWGFDKPSQAAAQELLRFWKEDVMNGYLLRLQVPSNFKKEQRWTLLINRNADPRLKNAVVSYPDRLRPCPVATPAAR